MNAARPSFFVRFPAAWDYIEPIRQCVDVCTQVCSKGLRERACLVSLELLENAVKYGDLSSEIEFELDVAPDAAPNAASGAIALSVCNRANLTQIRVLENEFSRLAVAGALADDVFARALERAKHLPQGSSMLGLARIVSEAELKLRVEREQVTVSARIA